MDLRQLKYFVAVAEQLSFSRAAESLFVTQPLLSQQIADLERILDRKLFNRNSRSISLTPAGVVLLNEAKIVLRMVDGIYQNVRSAGMEKQAASKLVLGFDELVPRRKAAELIYSIRQQMPWLSLEVHSYKYSFLFKVLENHEVDVVLSYQEAHQDAISHSSQGITSWTVGHEHMMLVCPPIDSEKPQDLGNMLREKGVFILLHDPRGIQQLLNTYNSYKISLPPLQAQESIQDMLINICAGGGVSVLPYSLCQEFGESNLTLLPLEDQECSLLDIRLYALRNNNDPNLYALVNLLMSNMNQA